MIVTTLSVLSFAALTAAQSSSSTVSIFLPNADTQSSLVGSIAGADATATTYVIGCAAASSDSSAAAATSGLIDDDGSSYGCGFDQSETITQGPSTFHWVFSETQVSAALTVDCTLSGTTKAVCTESASGSILTAAGSAAPSGSAAATDGGFAEPDQGLPAQSTGTLLGSDFPPFQQVVITAGFSNLKASGSGSSSGASTTGSATTKGDSSGMSGSSTATGTSSSATTKSNNAAMVVEPALAMGAGGMIAVALAAIAL